MTINCRILSDAHIELVPPDYYDAHFNYILPKFRNDKNSVLILAGDIWSYARPESYIQFIKYINGRFKAIINIAGNHEFYRSQYPSGQNDFLKYIKDIPNFHFLDGSAVTIDDVVFIGAALWTDFNKHDEDIKNWAASYMNDYNLIRCDEGLPFTPDDALVLHVEDLKNITAWLDANLSKTVVVVTHHGCSMQSIHEKYKNGGYTNYYFTSDLTELIIKYQPKYWIHGHTHESLDYNIGKTNVVVNPVGYKARYGMNFENVNFNPKLIIKV